MALMNSSSFAYFVRLQLARTELAQSYEVGLIQQTPVPALSEEDIAGLALAVRRAWSLARSLDTTNETSHAFLLPQGPNERITGLDRAAAVREMEEIQRHIDDLAFDLYGIDTDDRALIQSARDGDAAISDDEDEDEDDDNGGHPGGGRVAQADTLISWFVGVAFGRFDIRLATEAHDLLPVGVMRDVPAEPEPFDPLPTRSPGMWPEGEPRVVTPPRIMVDDPHHNHDVWAHVAEVANQTGWPDPSNLRGWLAKEFFPLHIKMYSKSRRKAPIYWQLATPSASYSVWLYIHAFTKDTFFHVEDLVATKVLLEEGNTERLRDDAGDAPSAATRRALADQEAFLEELRGMLDEVRQVKPLWKPDLDDGVVINFAPLWRLVPQNKAWQRELKSTWDSLCAGEYDWAHLAMHLWPERVVPKCATDRSLAIAHGLEDEFWSEDSAGKWKAKATPTGPVKDLIAKRTSTAVSTARDSLIKALPPGGGAGGGRKRRAAPKARRRQ